MEQSTRFYEPLEEKRKASSPAGGSLPVTASYLLIHVEQKREGIPMGWLTSLYLNRTLAFHGLGDLLLKMEAVYDQLPVLQPDCKVCPFARQLEGEPLLPGEEKEDCLSWITAGEPPARGRNLAVFLVKTRFRRHGSWQGTIAWLEAEKQRNFVSALHCLKLMAEALERSTACFGPSEEPDFPEVLTAPDR